MKGIVVQELDALQTYLLVTNVASLIIHSLHVALARSTRGRGLNELPLSLLTAAGGCVGSAVVLLIWDRRTTKENAWLHVLTFCSIVIWGVAYGFTHLSPFDASRFSEQLFVRRDTLLIYLGIANIITLAAFCIDKQRAVHNKWRISEATLLALSIAGGSFGGFVAMVLLRHKIRSREFAWGLPLIMVAQLTLVAYLVNAGIL